MRDSELVSIALPVRDGAERLEGVVRSVLAQDHRDIELVISDNASTDATEELCRDLAAGDERIVYHRHPRNVGLLGNFTHAARISRGAFIRWIGDDDRLEPSCVSRALAAFAADERLILVTNQVAYTGAGGRVTTTPYAGPGPGAGLGSDDPVERFAEMLRLLNESPFLIDPLYGLLRRGPATEIPRRNMLREDEVYAAKLALAGPWAHVPEVLSHRNWRAERITRLAGRLDVPSWQSHLANTLQCRELLRWLRQAELTEAQRRRARTAVLRMFARRQRRTIAHRSRKLLSLVRFV
ncbi:glycosyltransferase family 2 protein [Nonomuraea fuscirosea]|uniref:glycosyltransferase family 2 protein n=1 Tax=Nonomuraea fuscirosea TaxID=1291556 RepID=UPI00343E6A3A